MKRAKLILLTMLLATVGFAQAIKGVWDASTATFTNEQYGIEWKLIENLDWELDSHPTSNAVFTVISNKTDIVLSLDVINMKNSGSDAWKYIQIFDTDDYYESIAVEAKKTGMEYHPTKPIKSMLCGLHANKIITKMRKYYPDHNLTMHSIKYLYQVLSNDKLYSLTIFGLSIREDELDIFEDFVTKTVGGFKID